MMPRIRWADDWREAPSPDDRIPPDDAPCTCTDAVQHHYCEES